MKSPFVNNNIGVQRTVVEGDSLKSGYWQVEMKQEDKMKTAFTTRSGLYQFRVMQFGLTNTPATFKQLMERVLSGLPPELSLVYLDDLFVHALCHLGLVQPLMYSPNYFVQSWLIGGRTESEFQFI